MPSYNQFKEHEETMNELGLDYQGNQSRLTSSPIDVKLTIKYQQFKPKFRKGDWVTVQSTHRIHKHLNDLTFKVSDSIQINDAFMYFICLEKSLISDRQYSIPESELVLHRRPLYVKIQILREGIQLLAKKISTKFKEIQRIY